MERTNQNAAFSEKGENYIEGDIIPDLNRFATSKLCTVSYISYGYNEASFSFGLSFGWSR